MKAILFFILVALSAAIFESCSDSTPPPNNYPLSLFYDSTVNTYGLFVIFNLKVTKNGVPVSGASLMETEENVNLSTYNIATSDSTGAFPEFAVSTDTLTELEFQAVKDSLKSNSILYYP
ncbi:MAG TPA: hypothetical protein VGM92_15375 [Candidatus Kapabacteria bacterium]|jgi:hypothetical protein